METTPIANQTITIHRYNTIIVGAGAAGMNCAVHLYEFMTDSGVTDAQDKIAVVTAGLALGTSRMSGSDKQTYYKMGTSRDVPDSAEEFAKTLTAAGCCHGDLAMAEAIGSLREFYHLVQASVPFPHDRLGSFIGYKTDHDPSERATSAGPKTSKYMSQCLEKQLRRYGIQIHDHMEVVHLLTAGTGNSKRIVGVVTVDRNKLTGDDYAMNLAIGSKPDSWCNILKRGEIKDVDLVKVNGVRYFGGVGGVGFDSEVVALADHYRKILPLTIRYSLAVLLRITTFKFKEIQLSWDGGDFRGEILLIAFGNTQSYGRGMEITPGAQVDDGLLDVCLIKKMGKLRLVSIFPTVYKGGHIKIPGVKLFRTKQVLFKSKIPLKLFGEGEFISQTPLSLQIVPRILKVMVSS